MAAGLVAIEIADAAACAGRSDFRQAIDWERPWMASLRERGEPLCMPGVDWRAAVNAIAGEANLVTESGRSIEFVAQSNLPAHMSYEAFIHASGKVPTRENLHDFLNALVWLLYPRVKARLNAVQAADIGVASTSAASTTAAPHSRSRLRDALTLFDENAVLIACSEPLLFDLLRAHAWSALFLDHRSAFANQCDVFAFGHALMEKLVLPYKAITAHAWLVPVAADFFIQSASDKRNYLDRVIAQQLGATLVPANFSPLPVLGVPGWWKEQDDFFYADQRVFRPMR